MHQRNWTSCRAQAGNSGPLPAAPGVAAPAAAAAAHPGAATTAAAAAVAFAATTRLKRSPALSAQLATAASAAVPATATATASPSAAAARPAPPPAPGPAPAAPPPGTASNDVTSCSPPSSSPSSSRPALEGSPVAWASLGPTLDLIQQRLRVGSATFRLLTPRDVDGVMDMYLEKGLLDSDPYWTRAWPSAIALAATLLQRPELVRGKVVADLGAGLGLAGMAAAMAGAREVVLLDREPLALQCALLSAAATGLDAAAEPRPPEADPGSADGAADGAGWSLGHHRIEPLPADQLPSYGTLQLTPTYREQYRGRLSRLSAAETTAVPGGGGCAEAGQGVSSQAAAVADSSLARAARAAAEAEWRMLLELARGRSGGGGRDAGLSGPTPSAQPASPSPAAAAPAVYRAHVFDWTAAPEMCRLLPPDLPSSSGQQATGTASASAGRGRQQGPQRPPPRRQRRFDVVLACDVLYEDGAVGPISGLMPLLMEPDGGRLLLADPPNRTARNRERFLEELKSGPLRLAVEECSLQQCEVSKLDNEMAGGLAPTAETVPVQFLVFRSCVGKDTVGVKL